eukprot:3058339-Amphidinium_carterae.1
MDRPIASGAMQEPNGAQSMSPDLKILDLSQLLLLQHVIGKLCPIPNPKKLDWGAMMEVPIIVGCGRQTPLCSTSTAATAPIFFWD